MFQTIVPLQQAETLLQQEIDLSTKRFQTLRAFLDILFDYQKEGRDFEVDLTVLPSRIRIHVLAKEGVRTRSYPPIMSYCFSR